MGDPGVSPGKILEFKECFEVISSHLREGTCCFWRSIFHKFKTTFEGFERLMFEEQNVEGRRSDIVSAVGAKF